jgi:primosomal protein N' (replication factor Y)
MTFVRVAVNLPAVSGEYDYHLPEALHGLVGPGHLVTVPFGRQIAQGIVLDLLDQPAVAKTRDVIDLLDPAPVLTAAQIVFARLLARETLNPLAAIVDMMIPPGLSQHADTVFDIRYSIFANPKDSSSNIQSSNIALSNIEFSKTQKRLFELLSERGPLRGRQIDRHFAKVDWRKSAQALIKQGILTGKSVLPPVSVRPKFVRTAQLAVLPEVAEAAMSTLGKTPATLERRQKALRFLINEPLANLSWIYAESGCTAADLHELAERELIVLGEAEIFRDPLGKNAGPGKLGIGNQEVLLTADQQAVLAQILSAFALPNPQFANSQSTNSQSTNSQSTDSHSQFLLHGVTGSGKTEIYLRATAEALRRGRQVLILVPEIALTPQTVNRFLARFPGQVGLVHSKLSEGERYDTWRRARNGQLSVIIGARSALFTPLANIGLIVADECHDGSYYQSEPPFYDAIHAARMVARLSGAVCILGSATPTVALKYQAGIISLNGTEHPVKTVSLPARLTPTETGVIPGASLPPVQVIDMREELKAGRRGIFSRALAEALAETVERGEQAILFLNRRGTATYVFCRDCGFVAKCPNCDTPLTYHIGQNLQPSANLICHRCGYTRNMMKKCPTCNGNQIREFGLGSERVEHEVKTLLPAARVLRWDWETTREKDAHELILTHFANHNADILVGTQMLAKGLDLPLVTLVGIVLADVGVNLPDPFAAERAFQVLTQVAGRAGRSTRGGRVVMQTFQPDHYAIQAAAGHDYAAFYEREIAYRRALGYPPFGRLVRLEFRHSDNAEAEKVAKALAERLSADLLTESRVQTDLIGPVPCFFAKMNGIYRWQIILRGPDPVSLLRGRLPDGWRVEVDPVSLL